jgi:multicomponent Na+:H+ antiporter subunit C
MIDLFDQFNYIACIFLMMIGLYTMAAKTNLVKKILGMSVFQTAIILFYISTAAKKEATLPIIPGAHGAHHVHVNPAELISPLPHVLMLTAIVVSVATLGVALALSILVYRRYRTLEEDEINERIRSELK